MPKSLPGIQKFEKKVKKYQNFNYFLKMCLKKLEIRKV